MNQHTAEGERELAFLREQLSEAEHKVARLQHAVDTCQRCLEAEGLAKMLTAAQAERRLLTELIAFQSSEQALSLDTVLLYSARHFEQQSSHLGRNWGRGRPIPPDYWEAEGKRAFVKDLLRRYHAWRADRPYYPDIAPAANNHTRTAGTPGAAVQRSAQGSGVTHPWFVETSAAAGSGSQNGYDSGPEQDEKSLDALEEQIHSALRRVGFPDDHLRIIVQPRGFVIVTGYAHDAGQRALAVRTLEHVEGIHDLLTDIQIMDATRCPACQPDSTFRRELSESSSRQS